MLQRIYLNWVFFSLHFILFWGKQHFLVYPLLPRKNHKNDLLLKFSLFFLLQNILPLCFCLSLRIHLLVEALIVKLTFQCECSCNMNSLSCPTGSNYKHGRLREGYINGQLDTRWKQIKWLDDITYT